MKESIVEEEKISTLLGAFTVASVAIGAGIVAIPYAMSKEGLTFSLFYYIFNYVIGIYAVYLLLQVKNATGLSSYPEQANYCFGKSSVIIVNIFVLIAFGVLPIAYFNVFADLIAGLVGDWFYGDVVDKESIFWCTKLPWVLLDALFLVYLVLKKQMAELKIASLILFLGVIAFLACLAIQLLMGVDSKYTEAERFPKGRLEVWKSHPQNAYFWATVSTSFLAYSF